MSPAARVAIVIAIYIGWIAITVVAYVAGASGPILGALIGAPIGWTIAIVLIVAFAVINSHTSAR